MFADDIKVCRELSDIARDSEALPATILGIYMATTL